MTRLDYNVYFNGLGLYMIRGKFYNEKGLLVDTTEADVDLKEFRRLSYGNGFHYLKDVLLLKNESHKDFLNYLIDYMSEIDETQRDCDVYFHKDLNITLTEWGGLRGNSFRF
jgi:hypothetical protein